MDCDKSKSSVFSALRRGKLPEYILCALIAALIAVCYLFGGSGGKGTLSGSLTGSDIELRMAKTLSFIAGAGRVEVMITHEAAPDSGNDWWSGGEQTDFDKLPVRGAIIVAQGAKDIAVRLELLKAAQTLLNVPASKVEVFEMTAQ